MFSVLCKQIMEGAPSMSVIQGFHTFLTAVPTTHQQPGSTYAHLSIEAKKMTESQLLLGERLFLPLLQQKGGWGTQSWTSIFHMIRVLCGPVMGNRQGITKPESRLRKTDLSHQYLSSPYNSTCWNDGDIILHLLEPCSRALRFSPQAGRGSRSDGMSTASPARPTVRDPGRQQAKVWDRVIVLQPRGTKRLHEATLLPMCESGQPWFPPSWGDARDNTHTKTWS